MDLPTDAEDVRSYQLHHELSRPRINWIKVLSVMILFEFVNCTCLTLLHLPVSSFFIYFETIHIIVVLLFGKQILRLVIKIYQRYASEATRRQCTCKPTCSEYALLALDKYWWGKAAWLIVKRVTQTCQRPGYKIDYP